MKQIQLQAKQLREKKQKNVTSNVVVAAPVEIVQIQPAVIDDDKSTTSQDSNAKFELEKCTTLIYMTLSGVKTEVMLRKRIASYTELQRDIARYFPKSNKMFKVQNSQGETILSTDLRDHDILRIKEILIKPDKKMLRELGTRWEETAYHAEKLNWSTSKEEVLGDESKALANSQDDDAY